MKYIIFEDFSGQAVPLLFPDRIRHEELREVIPYSKVLSAGYVAADGGGFRCHGESKELDARARPQDGEIIAGHFRD